MYTNLDVQTTLTFARLHQDDVRASYPRRRSTWLRRRTDKPALAPPRALTPLAPTPHRTASA